MEEESKWSKSSTKNDYFKSKKSFDVIKLKKKYELTETNYIRYNSCNYLINFVPKLSPKQSFCKPSLLVLNPEENDKHKTEEIEKKKLSFDSNSEDNSFELSFESSEDEEAKNTNEEENKKEFDSKKGFNLDNKLKSDFDDDNKCNRYDSGEYVTILDILSMNHKSD